MEDIRVGCASWTDKALIEQGNFYPQKSMSAEDRLKWYAQFFSCVEVNSSYYAIPSPDTVESWVKRTPADFMFGVKAWAPMTGHRTQVLAAPPPVRRYLEGAPRTARGEIEAKDFPKAAFDASFDLFRRSMEPLAKSGKLGFVLFQFGPWVKHSVAMEKYLVTLRKRLSDWPIAVEFRNDSWIPRRTPHVLKLLNDNELANVAVDCPWMPLVPEATGPLFLLRCHGQNVAGWRAQMDGKSPTVAEKYDYRYTDEEVKRIADILKGVKISDRKKILIFNNNNKDYPVTNALTAKKLLGQSALDPEPLKKTWKAKSRKQAELFA